MLVLALLAAGAATRAAADESQGAVFKPPTFADDTLTYVFGPAYRNPFITSPSQPDGADISRNAIEFKHVDAWKHGHNLVEIIIKKSSDVEPAAGGGTGALGLYSIFRSGVGINRVAGRPIVALGPLRDVAIQAGTNLETKSTDYAPQERTLYLGPSLQFRFGAGFLNVGLHLRKEWNHNGHLGVNESYDVDFNVEPVWHLPFRIGGARLAFDGHADYNTAKGKDAAGRGTRAEFIARPLLKLDVSPLVGRKLNVLQLGVGFEYWHNMFGKDADKVPGANQFTAVFTLAVHLPLGGSGHAVLDRMGANGETYLAVDADTGRMLRLLAESTGAKHAVEIGTSTGYSALWTLLGLRATGGRLTTFELDAGRAGQARKHFQEAGVDTLVEVVVGDAHETVKGLKGPIDLVFLDADKEGYASYLKTLLPLLRPGGLIAADNVAMAPEYLSADTTDPQLDTVFFGRFAVTLRKR